MEKETVLACAICGCDETQRPLLGMRFEGKAAWICPGCVPALIHKMPAEEVAAHVRTAQKAGRRPA